MPRFTPASGTCSTNNDTKTTNDHTLSYQITKVPKVPLCKGHLSPSLASAPLRTLRSMINPFHPYLPSPHVCAPFQARLKLTSTVRLLVTTTRSTVVEGEMVNKIEYVCEPKRQKLKRMPSARRLPCTSPVFSFSNSQLTKPRNYSDRRPFHARKGTMDSRCICFFLLCRMCSHPILDQCQIRVDKSCILSSWSMFPKCARHLHRLRALSRSASCS